MIYGMVAAPLKSTAELMKCDVTLSFSYSLFPASNSLSPTYPMQACLFPEYSKLQNSFTIQNAHCIRGGDIQEETRKKAVPFERFILKSEWLIDSAEHGGEDEF